MPASPSLFRPFIISALGIFSPLALSAQAVPVTSLASPGARFAEPFDQITAVRELSDGRVIVSDLFAKAVTLVDFRTNAGTAVGREGQGPGEFAFPTGLVALPGDSTLLVDPAQRRFLRIAPDGKPAGLVSFPDGVGGLMAVKGSDRQGRVYFQGSPFAGQPGREMEQLPDSAPVLRWDRGRARIDTLGMVKIPTIARAASGGGGARAVVMRQQPFTPADDWSVTPDGRVGVARTGDYHVEWWGPKRVSGRPVPHAKVPVSQGDKDAFARRAADTRGRFTVSMGGPARGRGSSAPPPRLSEPDWPEFKPPFVGSVLANHEGHLWVPRAQPAGAAPLYDVFDAQGTLVRQVRLAKGSRLVGFGARSVYVAQTDEDELEWLERHQ